MYYMVYNHPERTSTLSSLRIGISGASAMPAQLMQDCSSALSITILEAWGLTECSASATIQRMNMPYKEGSVGLAHPGVEVGVMDDAGNLLGPNEVGELVIRGPLVMKGLYKRPEETEAALRGGWLHSRGQGYYDEKVLLLVDRKKENGERGGREGLPPRVEELIYTIPPSPRRPSPPARRKAGGDTGAVGGAQTGRKPLRGGLVEFLSERLARFKVPAGGDLRQPAAQPHRQDRQEGTGAHALRRNRVLY